MMTREEAIKLLKQYQGYEPMFPDGETLKHAFDLTDETVDTLLTALRPVSREQVERVCGKWIIPTVIGGRAFNIPHCSVCNGVPCGTDENTKFCAHCGAPMTDEAVQMVMERLEALYASDT